MERTPKKKENAGGMGILLKTQVIMMADGVLILWQNPFIFRNLLGDTRSHACFKGISPNSDFPKESFEGMMTLLPEWIGDKNGTNEHLHQLLFLNS